MGGRCPELEESYRVMRENLLKLPESANKFLVTVSFDDTKITPKTLVKDIIRRLARIWVHDYQFTIEQRGEAENDYHGIHVHILITTTKMDKNPSHVKKECASWFKSMINGPQYVDVKKITTDNGVGAYLTGKKQDPDKDKKCMNDKRFRKLYKMHDTYIKDGVYTDPVYRDDLTIQF